MNENNRRAPQVTIYGHGTAEDFPGLRDLPDQPLQRTIHRPYMSGHFPPLAAEHAPRAPHTWRAFLARIALNVVKSVLVVVSIILAAWLLTHVLLDVLHVLATDQ